jgi:hypothetical protein
MGKSWKEKPDKFRRQLQKKQKKHNKGPKPQKDENEDPWGTSNTEDNAY